MEQQPTKKIGIIGTGDYARALCKRLLFSGYDVTIGSRKPAERCLSEIDETLQDVAVTTVERCLTDNAVVFLAVHHGNHEELLSPYKEELRDKIIVDISNRERPSKSESNAENLSAMLPWSRVVKAFNTVSAYAMESDQFGGSRRVFVAGDRAEDRERIGCVARDMGFSPVDCGALRASRRLEAYPLKLMTGWGRPTLFTVVVFLFWSLFVLGKQVFYALFGRIESPTWDSFVLTILNKSSALTALTLLSLTYLPSCFASILQIYNGTKSKRFPILLDRWMKARKMLGTYSLLFSVLHASVAITVMSPTFFPTLYKTADRVITLNSSQVAVIVETMPSRKGEFTIFIGILAFVMLLLLGITTLPSVAESLNWREWLFWQSQLGFATLVLATGHVIVFSLPDWLNATLTDVLSSNAFWGCAVAVPVVTFRMILLAPCISNYVGKLRKGWERKPRGKTSTNSMDSEARLTSVTTHM